LNKKLINATTPFLLTFFQLLFVFIFYKPTTYARTTPKIESPADPTVREAALLGELELLAATLEVGEPVPLLLPLVLPLLLLLELWIPSEAIWSAGILSVCTGGGYCVNPVQVGNI
jgi:hypothetical protein